MKYILCWPNILAEDGEERWYISSTLAKKYHLEGYKVVTEYEEEDYIRTEGEEDGK